MHSHQKLLSLEIGLSDKLRLSFRLGKLNTMNMPLVRQQDK